MHLSCSSCVMGDRGILSALARMRQLGFRYFDLFALERYGHLWPSRLLAESAPGKQPGPIHGALAQAIAETGLRPSSFNCSFSRSVNDPDESARAQVEAEFLAILDLAIELECPILTLQPGEPWREQGLAASLDRVADGLQRLAQLARGSKVQLSFEPHVGSVAEKPTDAMRLARWLWPGIAVTYDPSHFVAQGNVGILVQSEALLECAVHVHVRNAAPCQMQTPMEQGTLDFGWLINALRNKGYQGVVAIEYLDSAEADAIKLRDLLLDLGVCL